MYRQQFIYRRVGYYIAHILGKVWGYGELARIEVKVAQKIDIYDAAVCLTGAAKSRHHIGDLFLQFAILRKGLIHSFHISSHMLVYIIGAVFEPAFLSAP